MFSFFKKKNADEVVKTGGDKSISSQELIQDTLQTNDNEDVHTELSIHPAWNLPKEKEYVFRFLNNDLHQLKPNQISLAGVEVEHEGDALHVTAFLRNSLSKAIKLERAELLLLDKDETVIASKEFDLSELGEMPGLSSRPWMFIFEKESIINSVPLLEEGWSLAFNVSSLRPHSLDLEKTWEESLPEEEKAKLRKIVEDLPPLKPKEFNILGLQAKTMDTGDLYTTILFRNGNPRAVQVEQLPLEVIDSQNTIVARAAFQLDNFEIKANTTKPWTFVFSKDSIIQENPDLTKWAVRPIQS
ncbi:accessory Sec system S-layer assembly protein [Rossellomorea oryzaecorticis]|uniref:Accessory Sec system S-layer assembly protein n=1 Tax=Rossellomorea oryzaecorticis TaxID=1396505 RepID=A0ABW8VLM6_9BACI